MTSVWKEDIYRCHQRPTEHNGVKRPWPETWRGTVHRTNLAPTSFVRNRLNVLTYGTTMIARKFVIDWLIEIDVPNRGALYRS